MCACRKSVIDVCWRYYHSSIHRVWQQLKQESWIAFLISTDTRHFCVYQSTWDARNRKTSVLEGFRPASLWFWWGQSFRFGHLRFRPPTRCWQAQDKNRKNPHSTHPHRCLKRIVLAGMLLWHALFRVSGVDVVGTPRSRENVITVCERLFFCYVLCWWLEAFAARGAHHILGWHAWLAQRMARIANKGVKMIHDSMLTRWLMLETTRLRHQQREREREYLQEHKLIKRIFEDPQ